MKRWEKRSGFMKTKWIPNVLMCILSLFFLYACQSTPEKDIVINKGGGKFEETIYASAVPANRISTPQTEKREFLTTDQKTKITVDAKVVIPDIDNYPIAKVVDYVFDQEAATRIIKGIFGDKKIYNVREETDLTKDEIMTLILEIKAGVGSGLKENDPKAYEELIKPDIDRLERLYVNAPEIFIPKEASGLFDTIGDSKPQSSNTGEEADSQKPSQMQSEMQLILVEAEMGKDRNAELYLEIYMSGKKARMGYNNLYKNQAFAGGLVTNNIDSPPGLSISFDDAKKIAIQTVADMNIQNMCLDAYGITPSGEGYQNVETYDELPKCFAFYFKKTINSINETYVDCRLGEQLGDNDSEGGYIYNSEDEYLEVFVNDSGVLHMYWINPTSITEITNTNVELLAYDEIMSRFEQQIKINKAFSADYLLSVDIHIEKIVLGLARIPSKNEPGVYLLVPAWDFIGYSTTVIQEDNGRKDEHTDLSIGRSFLTINAIDGSIIKRYSSI